jgi:hypothetical protein
LASKSLNSFKHLGSASQTTAHLVEMPTHRHLKYLGRHLKHLKGWHLAFQTL